LVGRRRYQKNEYQNFPNYLDMNQASERAGSHKEAGSETQREGIRRKEEREKKRRTCEEKEKKGELAVLLQEVDVGGLTNRSLTILKK